MLYPTKVLENRTDAPDAFTLILQKPEEFSFVAGQFVHLQITLDGKPIRRSYTIASAPHEEEIHITIRTQEHGKVSPVLARLDVGDELILVGPFGLFTRSEDTLRVYIAGGSGITPFVSFVRDAIHVNDTTPTVLMYSNKYVHDVLYAHEFAALDASWFTLKSTLTQEEHEDYSSGRFSAEDLSEYAENAVFYLCGSNEFIRAFTQYLIDLEVSPDRIRTENFGNIAA